MLARHNDVEFERGGLKFKVHVPDEVDFKLELEIGNDENELEIVYLVSFRSGTDRARRS